MVDLVSKLQYKNYETGEYSDERLRNLSETLTLIQNFPWEEQRPLTEIKLTGPSITIQNNEGAYLKLGLFFNSKFCIYLLNEANHFFEAHFSTLKEACEIVTDFFGDQLPYEKFEKHSFSFNKKRYFFTKLFYYRIGWQQALAILPMALSSFYFLCIFYLVFRSNNTHLYTDTPLFAKLLFPAFAGFFIFRLSCLIYRCYTCRNLCLELSQGKDNFAFTQEGVTHTYLKSDIEKIIIYGSDGGRVKNWLGFSEIYFKDETVLRFCNILIDVLSFRSKFPQELIVRSSKSQYLMF